jgi:hypothetical protein
VRLASARLYSERVGRNRWVLSGRGAVILKRGRWCCMVRLGRPILRASSVVCRLFSIAVLALPGGHHGGILPGKMVDDGHNWAMVCANCPRVLKTMVVYEPDCRCDRCGGVCQAMEFQRCSRWECRMILIYRSLAETRGGISCSNGEHQPAALFVGEPDPKNRRIFHFVPNLAR